MKRTMIKLAILLTLATATQSCAALAIGAGLDLIHHQIDKATNNEYN